MLKKLFCTFSETVTSLNPVMAELNLDALCDLLDDDDEEVLVNNDRSAVSEDQVNPNFCFTSNFRYSVCLHSVFICK